MKAATDAGMPAGYRILLLCLVLVALPLGIMLTDDGESARAYRHDLPVRSPVAAAPGAAARVDGEALVVESSAGNAATWIEFALDAGNSGMREKLRIELGAIENLSAVVLNYPNHPRQGHERYARIVDLDRGYVYFGLSPTEDDRIRLEFLPADRRQTMSVTLEGVTVMSRSLIDSNRFFVLLALGTATFVVIAGTLLAALCGRPSGEPGLQAAVALPGAAVAYFFLVYAAMVVARQVTDGPAALAAGVAVLAAALAWHVRRDRCARLLETFARWSGPIAGYLVVVTIATLIVKDGMVMPLQEASWSHIAHYKTFGGHTAHDLGFQYLNGLAIAKDLPFADFYEAPHLVRGMFYDVEDRQVLGGVLYAPWRNMLMPVSPYVGDTYAVYALFGIALTALAVFPVIAFCRRYTRLQSVPLILFVLSANAFVLVNYYYTWFKLLGGGFVIAGVLLLAVNASALRHWIGAGLSFGIAASFHAGAALSLPFLVLYFLARLVRDSGSGVRIPAIRFAALCLAFLAVIAPWSIVKAIHFEDNHTLLRQHFLIGEPLDGSLSNTASNFFERVPPAEQMNHRMSQLSGALRFDALQRIAKEWANDPVPEFLHAWSLFEFRYIAILLYPLLVLVALSALLRPAVGPARPPPAAVTGGIARERNALFAITSLSVVAVMFAMYTNSQVDSMSLVPSAAVVIVYLLTANALCASSRIGRHLLFAYLAFSAVRLVVSYGVG